jgi:hypothetical protein
MIGGKRYKSKSRKLLSRKSSKMVGRKLKFYDVNKSSPTTTAVRKVKSLWNGKRMVKYAIGKNKNGNEVWKIVG